MLLVLYEASCCGISRIVASTGMPLTERIVLEHGVTRFSHLPSRKRDIFVLRHKAL